MWIFMNFTKKEEGNKTWLVCVKSLFVDKFSKTNENLIFFS